VPPVLRCQAALDACPDLAAVHIQPPVSLFRPMQRS
jgi:hypothetical protein